MKKRDRKALKESLLAAVKKQLLESKADVTEKAVEKFIRRMVKKARAQKSAAAPKKLEKKDKSQPLARSPKKLKIKVKA